MTDVARPIRLGILRPDRPAAVVALAETRVLSTELERRLGPVVLDPRVAGDPIGGWQPIAHAAWPVDIDAELDATLIWGDDLPPLTTLFGRTVEPAAAEVRRRMLHHLGMLPVEIFDQPALDALAVLPLRPTDVWLITCAAEHVELDDPEIAAFAPAAGAEAGAELDAAFDRLAGAVPAASPGRAEHELARARAAEAMWHDRAADLRSELDRAGVEAAARLDRLAAENRVLRERIERLQLESETPTTGAR
jgi:hypothetical protein